MLRVLGLNESHDPPLPSSPCGVQVGTLLSDKRRVNVLLSRAKHKLVIVGSRSTLAGATPAESGLTSGATRPLAMGAPAREGHVMALLLAQLGGIEGAIVPLPTREEAR